MAKGTQEIKIVCDAARIEPYTYKHCTITVEGPRIHDLLAQIDRNELIEFVRENIDLEKLWPQTELENVP